MAEFEKIIKEKRQKDYNYPVFIPMPPTAGGFWEDKSRSYPYFQLKGWNGKNVCLTRVAMEADDRGKRESLRENTSKKVI